MYNKETYFDAMYSIVHLIKWMVLWATGIYTIAGISDYVYKPLIVMIVPYLFIFMYIYVEHTRKTFG